MSTFIRHDIANSHVGANVKAIMEKCIAENEADKFVSNLKVWLHLGILFIFHSTPIYFKL